MKAILVLLAIAAVALAKFQYPEEWELWKKVTINTLTYVSIHHTGISIVCSLLG